MKRILLVLAAATALLALPMTATAQAPKKNIVQTASDAGQFKTLVKLVKSAGLVGALSGKDKLTVFAPTDKAFAKLPKSTLTALGKDKAQLKKVLLYHVVKGNVTAAKVVKLKSAKTLNGASVAIKVRKGTVYVNKAKVTTADVLASNGVIHIIDTVLLPPS